MSLNGVPGLMKVKQEGTRTRTPQAPLLVTVMDNSHFAGFEIFMAM